MAGMADRRAALMWAIGWWFVRRWVRRRTTRALASAAASASARRPRGRWTAVVGALALVGAIAAGLVAWRRLSRGDEGEDGGWKPPPDEPPEPAPTPTPEAVAA